VFVGDLVMERGYRRGMEMTEEYVRMSEWSDTL
jgi:hypothetical protein